MEAEILHRSVVAIEGLNGARRRWWVSGRKGEGGAWGGMEVGEDVAGVGGAFGGEVYVGGPERAEGRGMRRRGGDDGGVGGGDPGGVGGGVYSRDVSGICHGG